MEEIDNICFVCDQNIPLEKWKYQLQVTATKRRNAPVADLIQELVGEEFEVLVGERDAVCSKCMNLLNLMDSLTFQLGEVKSTITRLLHTKYNLTEDDIQLQVEYDDSTKEDREPLHKCEICKYQTKYEKEFNMHLRTYPEHRTLKSPVSINSFGKYVLNSPQNLLYKTGSETKSNSDKRPSSKKLPKKKKPQKKKIKNVKKVSKAKKQKIVFQCSVCNKVFPSENEIRLHCKRDHGNDKIIVSDEEEYDDIQTLESDEEMYVPKTNQKKKTTKRNKSSTKTKLDFLDDWVENEDDDDLHSPAKTVKLDEEKSRTVSAKLKDLFRSSLKESDTDDDDMDEKDVASQPTCVFCQAKFSSFEAVQDHVKLSHKGRSNLRLPKQSSDVIPPANINSVEIDSTTDIAEIKNQSNVKDKKTKVKSYKCNVCGIKKVSLKFIKEHIKSHKRKMSLQCKKCGVVFKKLIALKVHAYKCFKAGTLLLKCKQCKFKFLNLVKLKNHVKTVHSKNYLRKKVNSSSRKSNVVCSKVLRSDSEEVTDSNYMKENEPEKETDNSKISVSEVSSTSLELKTKRRKKGSLPRAPYRCNECNVDFPQPNKFQTHCLRHTAHTCNTLGICVFCEKLFLDPEHLTVHNKTVHEIFHSTKPKCTVCSKKYSLIKDLRLHFLRCHFSEKAQILVKQVSDYKNKKKTNVENEVYNKVFKELQDLTGEGNDTEETSANGENVPNLTYNCPVCNFSSQEREEVKTHLPSHVQHYCNICESVFRPEEVIKHLENHSIDSQLLKCSVCDQECHDELHLQAHTQSSHPEPKQNLPIHRQNMFHCNMCEKFFFAEKRLLAHKASQHGEKAKKVLTCSKCQTDFYSERTYQNHVEFAHRSGLNCKYCDKSLDNINRLIFHEKNHLKEIKSIIKCNICGKVLKTKQALKTHKSLHGSNNSVCEVCNKTFKSYHNLREHSAKHSGLQEKKFFCEVCRKGFYYYDSHTRHRRIHLDPLPFQCKTCKERFQTKLKLLEHKKICSINISKGS